MHKTIGGWMRIMLLFIILGMQLHPVSVEAKADRSEISTSVEQQIRIFADSIDQSNAISDATVDLASHGLRGDGKDLTMDASSPLTAILLNSEVVQEGFAVSFADIIVSMQQLDMKSVPRVQMSFNWYGTENSYGAYIQTDSEDYPDNLDWMVTNEQFKGTLNEYDKALEWMVAGCEATAVIDCIKDTGFEKTYKVTTTFFDRFDFSTANTSGFKKLLSGLGMLLFREFDWSCAVTMYITTPYSQELCSHTAAAYHWTYDGENRTMISDGDTGFRRNEATHHSQTAKDGTIHHYYELSSAVRLYHSKPWVLEYDVRKPVRIILAPVHNAVTKTYPQITQTGRTSLFAVSKDYAMAENTNGSMDRFYAYNYYGIKLQELFQYAYDKTYTFRLENLIGDDGSNRICLTVFETDTGVCCLDQVPMDDYYYYGGWMDNMELISNESNWLSGKDIQINYLGTGISGFDAQSCDLRIWEDGWNQFSGDYFTSKIIAPTCTTDGYTIKTCSRCGYTFRTDVQKANGHSYLDWIGISEPDCVTAGREYRDCNICGQRQEREIPAKGHSGGVDTCRLGAVCDICFKAYGEKNPDNHAFGTEIRNRVEASEFADGYSGDVHCKGCGEQLEKGTVIPATHTHNFAGEWSADAANHWHVCSCGEKSALEAHVPGAEPTETAPQLCTVCGWELKPANVHTHNPQKVEAKEATHTENGNKEYYICSCGNWYEDAEGTKLIKNHASVLLLKFELGDVDHNHKLTSMDAMLLMQYKAGLLNDTVFFCPECADVDGKMGINSMDAMLILQFRAGLITSFR